MCVTAELAYVGTLHKVELQIDAYIRVRVHYHHNQTPLIQYSALSSPTYFQFSLHCTYLLHCIPVPCVTSTVQRVFGLPVFIFPIRGHSTIFLLNRLSVHLMICPGHYLLGLTTPLAISVTFVQSLIQQFCSLSRSEIPRIDLSITLCAILSLDIIASDIAHVSQPYVINGTIDRMLIERWHVRIKNIF